MAFVRYIPESQLAPGDRVPDPDNIVQIHALHPAAMRYHYGLYRALMHDSGPVPRRQREMLAVRISSINRCRY